MISGNGPLLDPDGGFVPTIAARFGVMSTVSIHR
jgi:hypothetical protein